ncbi:MAG: type II toxin-antitoxin system RelE/ParE family toxin [Actinomycetota bacterium]
MPEAERSLTAQLEWIAEHHPWAALAMGDAIHAAVGRLADGPAMAQSGRVPGTRELVVVGTPSIVVHRIETSAVVILRVLHGTQRWPRD